MESSLCSTTFWGPLLLCMLSFFLRCTEHPRATAAPGASSAVDAMWWLGFCLVTQPLLPAKLQLLPGYSALVQTRNARCPPQSL